MQKHPIKENLPHALREAVGWGIAQGFIRSGRRAAALRRYDGPDTILSLCAHNPTPSVLRSLLAWLTAHGFRFLSEEDILGGRVPSGRKAWLSFDDGWAGFDTELLPVLEAFNAPVSLFIAPEETRRGFLWTNALMPYCPMSGIRALYAFPEPERIAAVAAVLKGKTPKMLMSPEAVAAVARHPLVRVGNHSATHLSCSDRPVSEVIDALRRAQETLTDWCGRAPRLFCYPFGHRTPETDAAVRAEGLHPIGLFPGIDRLSSFGAFRNMVYDDMSLAENTCRVLGSWIPIRRT